MINRDGYTTRDMPAPEIKRAERPKPKKLPRPAPAPKNEKPADPKRG